MYAISGLSSIYHLLYPDQDYTLCGFRAEKHDAEIPAKATLHVVEFVPPNRELCKQCDKMNNRRKGNSEGPGGSNLIRDISCQGESQTRTRRFFQVYEQKGR
jgi:hypothetical protein